MQSEQIRIGFTEAVIHGMSLGNAGFGQTELKGANILQSENFKRKGKG